MFSSLSQTLEVSVQGRCGLPWPCLLADSSFCPESCLVGQDGHDESVILCVLQPAGRRKGPGRATFRAVSWTSHTTPSPHCPLARSRPRGPAQFQGMLEVALLQAATCPAQSWPSVTEGGGERIDQLMGCAANIHSPRAYCVLALTYAYPPHREAGATWHRAHYT